MSVLVGEYSDSGRSITYKTQLYPSIYDVLSGLLFDVLSLYAVVFRGDFAF